MTYKFIEGITSDVMFEAEGKDLAGMLEQASLALFDVVCQRKKVKAENKIKISAEGRDEKELVYAWLSALLSESDANEIFFSKFEVKVSRKGKKFITQNLLWFLYYNSWSYSDIFPPKNHNLIRIGRNIYNFNIGSIFCL